MADEPKVLKLRPEPGEPEAKPAGDASDLSDLWFDPALGDGLTNTVLLNIPVGKPKDFFRVHPDPAYRRQTEVYRHKPEGQIEEENFIVAPSMRGLIEAARPATIVLCIYRDGSLRLWILFGPKNNEKDNTAWSSARAAGRAAMTTWVKLVWVGKAYQVREAQPGYGPKDPWKDLKLPTFDELILLAFGQRGIIRDKEHPIYRDIIGAAPKEPDADDDL